MTDESPNSNEKRLLSALHLSSAVEIDVVFDALPPRDADRFALAAPDALQWRAVFRGAPALTIGARSAPFATLAGLAPDVHEAPPVPGRLPKPGDADMPAAREWVVMTFGFVTEHGAALAAAGWSVALAKAMDSEPGDVLTFMRAQAFRPDWRGHP